MRIIVVGSGIAGLCAAVGLRKVGVDVAVYERAPELREVGAGITLWANAVRALDHLGAGDAVRRVALAMTRSELRARDGRTLLAGHDAADLARHLGLPEVVRTTHRADLVGALAGLLPDGVARYGFECVGVKETGDRVAVRFKNGHADEADAVVGADGIRSAVRAALFGDRPPRYAGYTCWRGIGPRPASLAPGYVGEWWGRGRRFGITTIPGDRVYWFAVKTAPANRRPADDRAELLAAFAGWADPVPELIASTPADKVIWADIVDRPPARPWGQGRAVLAGDAAHPTTPNLGQGGCMAIEDAVVLARCVAAAGDDPAAAFRAFEAERYKRTAAVTADSWRLGRLGQLEGAVSARLRDAVVGGVMRLSGANGLLRYARHDVGPLPS